MKHIALKIKELLLVLNQVVIKQIKMEENNFIVIAVCGIKKVRYVKNNGLGKKKPK